MSLQFLADLFLKGYRCNYWTEKPFNPGAGGGGVEAAEDRQVQLQVHHAQEWHQGGYKINVMSMSFVEMIIRKRLTQKTKNKYSVLSSLFWKVLRDYMDKVNSAWQICQCNS